jgi:hypothetical protein
MIPKLESKSFSDPVCTVFGKEETMNEPTYVEFEFIEPSSGKEVSTQTFATEDNWDDYDVIDPKSGKDVEPQPFASESDWDDYEVVDPRSGKEVEPQPFASDSEWDEHEVVDPRSGKEVEPQPFASDSDWDEYDVIDPRSGKEVEPQPFSRNDDMRDFQDFQQDDYGQFDPDGSQDVQGSPDIRTPNDLHQPDLPEPPVPEPALIRPLPLLIQEVPVLQLRGYAIQAAQNRQTGEWCAFYTGPSGRKYRLRPVPGSITPDVSFKSGGTELQLPIDIECQSTQEVLHVINQYDLVVPEVRGGQDA